MKISKSNINISITLILVFISIISINNSNAGDSRGTCKNIENDLNYWYNNNSFEEFLASFVNEINESNEAGLNCTCEYVINAIEVVGKDNETKVDNIANAAIDADPANVAQILECASMAAEREITLSEEIIGIPESTESASTGIGGSTGTNPVIGVGGGSGPSVSEPETTVVVTESANTVDVSVEEVVNESVEEVANGIILHLSSDEEAINILASETSPIATN